MLANLNNSYQNNSNIFNSKLWYLITILSSVLFMASISWFKWPDLLIDFGPQVYIPWQVSEGKILYKDVLYLYGPFSVYLHSFLFKIFGPGVSVVIYFNLLVVLLFSYLIFILFKNLSNHFSATVICILFITVFAMGQYNVMGNFNFICAYVYELPHGLILSFLAIYIFNKYVSKPKFNKVFLLGFISGLVLLTKIEVSVALVCALILGLLYYQILYSTSQVCRIKTFSLFSLGILLPLLLFLIYLCSHLSFTQALSAIFSPIKYALNDQLRALPLYQWVSGTSALSKNLINITLGLISLTFIFSFIAMVSYSRIPFLKSHTNLPIIFIISLFSIILLFNNQISWKEIIKPLPVFLLILTFYFIKKINESPRSSNNISHYFTQLIFSIFSFILLLKIIFNVHSFHYGFALALPGTLILVKFFLNDFPKWFSKNVVISPLYINSCMGLILIYIFNHIYISKEFYELKNYPVQLENNKIMTYFPNLDPRGKIVQEALNFIDTKIEKDVPIAPIPYGLMINFFTKHPNSLVSSTYNPGEALIFSEKKYLSDLKEKSPPYILLLEVDSQILGARYFGQDYAKTIYKWILGNYTLIKQFGETPFTGKGFGIQILKRKENNQKTNVS